MREFLRPIRGRWGVATLMLAALLGALVAPGLAEAQACPAGRFCFYVPPGMPLTGSHSGAGSRVFDAILSAPAVTVTGTYAIDGGAATAFSVSPGTSFRIPLSGGAALQTAFNTSQNRGVFISASSQELTVDFRETFDAEQYSATIQRSTIALGTRFRLAGYSLNNESVAEANRDVATVYAPTGATVTFTRPAGAALPFWAETPADTDGILTLTIAAGQTASVRTAGGFDFDGALLTSTAPIGVVAGGRGWAPGGCGDDGMDSVLPTSIWGSLFATRFPDGSDPATSRIRVLSDTAGTQVFLNGSAVASATINAGEFFTITSTPTITSIRTSQPAMVWMNAGQAGCELDTVYVPPLTFIASVATLSLDFNVLGGGDMSILIPDGRQTTLRVDGAAAAPTFSISELVPGVTPAVRFVRFALSAGDHNVRATSDFQAMLASRTGPSGLLGYYSPFRLPGCGDRVVNGSEGCDDGNGMDGDGCSALCALEVGWSCAPPAGPSVCIRRAPVVITTPAVDGVATSDNTPTISGTADPGAVVTVTMARRRSR